MRNYLLTGTLMMVLTSIALTSPAASIAKESPTAHLEKDVQRELILLPHYSLFDLLRFQVEGNTVTLSGQVTRPTLKSDAETAVKRIVGVKQVVNQIEVLPLSTNDDLLRLSLYRAIYGHGALETLSVRALPPIHILIKGGHVTLEGHVTTSLHKSIAGNQANGVSGVFSVTNNLVVENEPMESTKAF